LAGDGTTTATVLAQAIVKKDWKTLLQEQINGFETWYRQGSKAIVTDLAKQSKVVVQTQTK
jgi:chaperonin GroEL (HSP60 family)